MELRPKDAGQSSGIRLQHFQEEFVHHDTAVFLEVEPELLGQQLDVSDGGQQQEELAQAAGLTPVTRLDAFDQRVLQLVLKTPHRLPGLQPHVCNHHNHTNNRHWRQPLHFLQHGCYADSHPMRVYISAKKQLTTKLNIQVVGRGGEKKGGGGVKDRHKETETE